MYAKDWTHGVFADPVTVGDPRVSHQGDGRTPVNAPRREQEEQLATALVPVEVSARPETDSNHALIAGEVCRFLDEDGTFDDIHGGDRLH